MKKTRRTLAAGLVVLASVSFTSTAAASAQPQKPSPASSSSSLVVLTKSGKLVHYDSRIALLPKKIVPIKGLKGKDRLIGIDTRPATDGLYGMAASGQLYTVDANGRAIAVGTPVALDGRAIGFDFNPAVDRIRLVTDTGQNLRLVPDTGALAATDGTLAYAAGDVAAGAEPGVTAAGYTDSVSGATSTALYGLDTTRDTLVLQGTAPGTDPAVSPNSGQLFTVARLGIRVEEVNGFDIAGVAKNPGSYNPSDYTAFAAVKPVKFLPTSLLVKVNLKTGATTPVGGLLGEADGLTVTG